MPSPPTDPSPLPRTAQPWRRILLATGTLLVALAAGAWVSADLRGKALWRQHLAELETAGRSLDLERYHIPVVEGTFWADPFVRAMAEGEIPGFAARRNDLLSADPNYVKGASPSSSSLPNISSLGRSEALERFFPGMNLTVRESAERILGSLNALDEDLDRFREALRLAPSTSVSVPEFLPYWVISDPAKVTSGFEQVLTLRARCLLELGRSDESLRDIEDLFLCIGRLHQHGLVMDSVVATGRDRRVLQVLWHGLERESWDAASLESLDELLQGRIAAYPDFNEIFERELARDRAGQERWIPLRRRAEFAEWLSTTESGAHPLFVWPPNWGWIEDAIHAYYELIWHTQPPGSLLASVVERDRWAYEIFLNSEIPLHERVESRTKFFRNANLPNRGDQIVFAPAALAYTALAGYEDTLALLHMARAAVAAERHHLDTGRYPAAWDEFVPQWLDSIPGDPWSGGSLLYRLDGEERPVIYSVGRNGLDGGGVPQRGPRQGDLVWRYSAEG